MFLELTDWEEKKKFIVNTAHIFEFEDVHPYTLIRIYYGYSREIAVEESANMIYLKTLRDKQFLSTHRIRELRVEGKKLFKIDPVYINRNFITEIHGIGKKGMYDDCQAVMLANFETIDVPHSMEHLKGELGCRWT